MANNDDTGVFGSFFSKLKLRDTKTEDRANTNKLAVDSSDGAVEINQSSPGGFQQYPIDLDVAYNSNSELIETYREISNYSIVDYAIEDVINEAVAFSEDESPISIDLTDLEDDLSESIRNKMYESYEKIENLLNLKDSIHTRLRQFYIDGRLDYQKVVDNKRTNQGLLDIVELDPRLITKVRNKEYDPNNRTINSVSEYFIYDEKQKKKQGTTQAGSQGSYTEEKMMLDPETITHVTSGLTDNQTGYTVSWLHKAVRPANQLRMMENALVIYRISRAPERRLFYVDVSNLPNKRAEQYMNKLKNMYRNKMSFDPDKGTFKDNRHLMTMQEDFWLPRSSNGRGTEVDTLPSGQNLGEISDIEYFQKQLYKSLNVPVSRLESDSMMPVGRAAEINRDELKFSKFVSKIRKRFNIMILDLLRTELILTRVLTIEEWNKIKHKIRFKYAQDSQLEEMRELEMRTERIDQLDRIVPYVGEEGGGYFSKKWVRENVLKQTEEERNEIDDEIEEETPEPEPEPTETSSNNNNNDNDDETNQSTSFQ